MEFYVVIMLGLQERHNVMDTSAIKEAPIIIIITIIIICSILIISIIIIIMIIILFILYSHERFQMNDFLTGPG